MNARPIECKFAKMGAPFKVNVVPERRRSKNSAVDLRQDRPGAFFELHVSGPIALWRFVTETDHAE